MTLGASQGPELVALVIYCSGPPGAVPSCTTRDLLDSLDPLSS